MMQDHEIQMKNLKGQASGEIEASEEVPHLQLDGEELEAKIGKLEAKVGKLEVKVGKLEAKAGKLQVQLSNICF
jgi:hypothetical protein